MRKVLQFVYGLEKAQKFESADLAISTLESANEYLLTNYEKMCGEYLEKTVNEENFAKLYNFALQYESKSILKKVRGMVGVMMKDKKHEKVFELTYEAFKDFVEVGEKAGRDGIFYDDLYHYEHPASRLIKIFHEYYKANPELFKGKTYPMDDFKSFIKWEQVSKNALKIVHENKYVSNDFLVTFLITTHCTGC